jgi:small-conductance mechanosensitive channel
MRPRSRVIHLFLTVALGLSANAAAQDPAAARAGAEEPTAPVVLDGAVLFSVRGITSYPAHRRAADIAGRIAAFASDRSLPPSSLTLQETPDGSAVDAGNRRLFVVLPADAELEGVTPQVLAQAYLSRVQEAVQRFRQEREPGVLGRNLARALAATLALVLGLGAGRRILRWLRSAVDRRYRHRVRDLQFRAVPIVREEQLWKAVHRAIGLAAGLIALVAVYAYLSYVLGLFPWTRGIGNSLWAMLLRPLATIGAGALAYLPNVVFLVVLALLTRYLLKVVRLFFRGVSQGTISLSGFDRDWAQPTDRMIRLLVVAFALVVAYPYIPGSGSEAFKGITILLGVLFSLGSPSVLGNLVAGQSLAFRRAFRVGDRIRIGEHMGDVAEIRLLTTYLRSPKNEQLVIPNSLILNSEVVNYSALAIDLGLILHTTVRIGYGTPWRQVEAMLLEAAARTRGILPQPDPFVLQKSLGEFGVVYEINVYVDNARGMPRLYSALHSNILDVFNEYGVQIMVPAYEGDPEQPKVVPRGQWFAAPAPPAEPSRTDGNSGAPAPV